MAAEEQFPSQGSAASPEAERLDSQIERTQSENQIELDYGKALDEQRLIPFCTSGR
jgi:hypothetical protein